MKLSRFRNRLQIDTSARDGITEILSGGSPFFWNGTALQFEIGLFRKDTLIDDLTNISQITLELKNYPTITSDPVMSATVLGSDLNKSLTLDAWNGGEEDDCHAQFVFTSDESDLDLGGKTSAQFWMVITAKRDDGQPVTVGASIVTVEEDGSDVAGSSVLAGGNFRLNAGWPELKFPDLTWHALTGTLDQDQYVLSVDQTASDATADFVSTNFRLNGGFPELKYSDGSWHALVPSLDQGQYVLDVNQTASESFTENGDHFRINLGFPELKFSDNSWHRIKPSVNGTQYTIDIEQTASV